MEKRTVRPARLRWVPRGCPKAECGSWLSTVRGWRSSYDRRLENDDIWLARCFFVSKPDVCVGGYDGSNDSPLHQLAHGGIVYVVQLAYHPSIGFDPLCLVLVLGVWQIDRPPCRFYRLVATTVSVCRPSLVPSPVKLCRGKCISPRNLAHGSLIRSDTTFNESRKSPPFWTKRVVVLPQLEHFPLIMCMQFLLTTCRARSVSVVWRHLTQYDFMLHTGDNRSLACLFHFSSHTRIVSRLERHSFSVGTDHLVRVWGRPEDSHTERW